jgi:tetratricopeptide (TPR) repeat protein
LRALGDQLGVSRPTIYAYVSGALQVPQSRLTQISAVTGKDPAFFDSLVDADGFGTEAGRLELLDAMLSPPNPKAASEIAFAVVESGEEIDSPVELARMLFRAGNALLQHGEYLDATQHLEHARRTFLASGQSESAASCSQSLGYCWTNLGQLDRARLCFEFSRDHCAPENRWTGLVSLAALTEREGDFAGAEAMLSSLRSQKDLPEEAHAYVVANQADLLCARGLWTQALGTVEVGLTFAYKEKLTDQVAELLIQKGTALTLLGDFEGASLALVRAGDVCFSLRDEARSTLQQLAWGRLLGFLGRLSESRKTVVLAMASATRGQYRRSESLAYRLLADICLARGDYDQAHDYSLQALSHAETHRYPANGVAARVTLALAECAAGRLEKAEAALVGAETLCAQLGLGEITARTLRAKAVVEWAKGLTDSAIDHWSKAAESAQEMGLAPLAAQILWERSQNIRVPTGASESNAFQEKARSIADRLLGQRVLFGPGMDLCEELVTSSEWLGQALG